MQPMHGPSQTSSPCTSKTHRVRLGLGLVLLSLSAPVLAAPDVASPPPAMPKSASAPVARAASPAAKPPTGASPAAASATAAPVGGKPVAPGAKPVVPAPVAAADPDFPRLNTEGMLPSEKDGLRRLLGKVPSSCVKSQSLLTSLKSDPKCNLSLVTARWIAKQFTDGMLESEVEDAYKKRFVDAKCYEIDTTGAQMKGDPNAPVTLIEFSDFECPSCRGVEPIIKQILAEYKNVRFVFMNFPLPMHPNAATAAAAALAAGKQGKFWDFHDALFANQGRLRMPDLLLYAKDMGLDVRRFQIDLEALRSRVSRERAVGDKLDLGGTPTFFVGCHKVEGRSSVDSLRSYIDAELAK